jgi:DNA polymerase IIIc chi subunit
MTDAQFYQLERQPLDRVLPGLLEDREAIV